MSDIPSFLSGLFQAYCRSCRYAKPSSLQGKVWCIMLCKVKDKNDSCGQYENKL